MAINPNTQRENRHVMVSGATGSGKSQVVKQRLLPRGSGHRVILWDPDEDYRVSSTCRYSERAAFARAVQNAIASGKGYRLAWSGRVDLPTFEWFCRVVWAALDGNHDTIVVIEELADVSPSAGKASPMFGELLRKGRKYGAQIVMVTQRGAEVSKTCWNQVAVKWIGQQQGSDVKRMAVEADVGDSALRALEPLQFYCKPQGATPAEVVKLRFKSN